MVDFGVDVKMNDEDGDTPSDLWLFIGITRNKTGNFEDCPSGFSNCDCECCECEIDGSGASRDWGHLAYRGGNTTHHTWIQELGKYLEPLRNEELVNGAGSWRSWSITCPLPLLS